MWVVCGEGDREETENKQKISELYNRLEGDRCHVKKKKNKARLGDEGCLGKWFAILKKGFSQ